MSPVLRGNVIKETYSMAQDFAKKFYKSKKWQRVRDYVLKRDGGMCQMPECYAPAEEVHHIKHLSKNNINDPDVALNPDNLISVCRACHFKIHQKEKIQALRRQARERNKEKEKILTLITFDDDGFPIEAPPITEK